MPHRSRIVPAELLSSAPKEHPLAAIQATKFWSEKDGGIPFEHQPGTPPYAEALRKLSYAIAQILKTVPPKEQRRPAAYLASDFKPATDKLRASLSHNFLVLPENPQTLLGLSAEELQQSLDRDFARCFVSIHPVSDAPGSKTLLDAQLAFARAQKKPRLLWSPAAPPDLAADGLDEWFTSQTEIEERIRRLWEKPPEAKSSGAQPLIYFLCPDRANKTTAESLLKILEARGVHIYASPLDGLADQALQTHVQALDELDGCLIYYGDIGRDWFDSVFLRVRKKIRQRGLPSAIFLAPPPTDHKTHEDAVYSVAWSPDGKTLASASWDKTIRLWDAASGQSLRTLSGHQRSLTSVAWSPDGKTLASGGFDATIRLWPGTLDALLDQVRDRIRLFSLSKDDCQRYFQKDSCPPLQ